MPPTMFPCIVGQACLGGIQHIHSSGQGAAALELDPPQPVTGSRCQDGTMDATQVIKLLEKAEAVDLTWRTALSRGQPLPAIDLEELNRRAAYVPSLNNRAEANEAKLSNAAGDDDHPSETTPPLELERSFTLNDACGSPSPPGLPTSSPSTSITTQAAAAPRAAPAAAATTAAPAAGGTKTGGQAVLLSSQKLVLSPLQSSRPGPLLQHEAAAATITPVPAAPPLPPPDDPPSATARKAPPRASPAAAPEAAGGGLLLPDESRTHPLAASVSARNRAVAQGRRGAATTTAPPASSAAAARARGNGLVRERRLVVNTAGVGHGHYTTAAAGSAPAAAGGVSPVCPETIAAAAKPLAGPTAAAAAATPAATAERVLRSPGSASPEAAKAVPTAEREAVSPRRLIKQVKGVGRVRNDDPGARPVAAAGKVVQPAAATAAISRPVDVNRRDARSNIDAALVGKQGKGGGKNGELGPCGPAASGIGRAAASQPPSHILRQAQQLLHKLQHAAVPALAAAAREIGTYCSKLTPAEKEWFGRCPGILPALLRLLPPGQPFSAQLEAVDVLGMLCKSSTDHTTTISKSHGVTSHLVEMVQLAERGSVRPEASKGPLLLLYFMCARDTSLYKELAACNAFVPSMLRFLGDEWGDGSSSSERGQKIAAELLQVMLKRKCLKPKQQLQVQQQLLDFNVPKKGLDVGGGGGVGGRKRKAATELEQHQQQLRQAKRGQQQQVRGEKRLQKDQQQNVKQPRHQQQQPVVERPMKRRRLILAEEDTDGEDPPPSQQEQEDDSGRKFQLQQQQLVVVVEDGGQPEVLVTAATGVDVHQRLGKVRGWVMVRLWAGAQLGKSVGSDLCGGCCLKGGVRGVRVVVHHVGQARH